MKPHERYLLILSLCSFMSSLLIGGLGMYLVVQNGPLSLTSNTLEGIKLCICAICVHCFFTMSLNWMYKANEYRGISIISRIWNCIKGVSILLLASFVFHAIAVCFGAPFFESIARTYHFAVLLTAQVCLPFCLFFGPDPDAWFKVFMANSGALEILVCCMSVGAILGSWLSAILIPLDWDKPWQEWPICCVTGGMLGYAAGLLLASICIPRQYKASQKSKFF